MACTCHVGFRVEGVTEASLTSDYCMHVAACWLGLVHQPQGEGGGEGGKRGEGRGEEIETRFWTKKCLLSVLRQLQTWGEARISRGMVMLD